MIFCCMSCVYERDVSASFCGCPWWVHYTGIVIRSQTFTILATVLFGYETMHVYLIRKPAKFLLVSFGIICKEVLLLNNLHACMGRMGARKMYIFIVIKKQCKVGIERFTPYQSRHYSRLDFFCSYQNPYNG